MWFLALFIRVPNVGFRTNVSSNNVSSHIAKPLLGDGLADGYVQVVFGPGQRVRADDRPSMRVLSGLDHPSVAARRDY